MWTDIVTAQLSDNIKLEQLTPAALGGLMEASYNGALMQGRKLFWWLWRHQVISYCDIVGFYFPVTWL